MTRSNFWEWERFYVSAYGRANVFMSLALIDIDCPGRSRESVFSFEDLNEAQTRTRNSFSASEIIGIGMLLLECSRVVVMCQG